MKPPTISIVTPSYNQGEFIEATIESVLSQKGDFFIEYTIMDGGSTDNTLEIIKKYEQLLKKEQYPIKCKGIKYLWDSKKDNGQYDAINKGFEKTTGEIMAWINSDDIYHEKAFSKIVNVFARYKHIFWVTSRITICNKQGEIIKIYPLIVFPRKLISKGLFNGIDGPFIAQDSTFWRRTLWEKSDKLDQSLKYAGDFKLWIGFAKEAQLFTLNSKIGKFRVHKKQKTNSLENYRKEIRKIIQISFLDKILMLIRRITKKVPLIRLFYTSKENKLIINI